MFAYGVSTSRDIAVSRGRGRPGRSRWAALALVAVIAAACGGDSGGDAVDSASGAATKGAFPVTIDHAHGSTTIAEEPQRVVSVGFSDQDPLLALGVVPVGVREFFGEQPDATWPWAQDELGDADPAVLDVAELNFEQIAGLKPDLIVGVSSGITSDEYQQLSRIAPTIARPKQYVDYGIPWDQQTLVIGRAVGRAPQAEKLVAQVEERVAAARQQHPEFGRASAIVARPGWEPGQFFVFGPQDSRSRFMTSLGFTLPSEIAKLAGEEFTAAISSEQLELLDQAGVVVWNVDTDDDRAVVEGNPIYQQLEIRRAGRDLFLDEQVNAALSFSTVLSLPVVLEELVPQLAQKVGG